MTSLSVPTCNRCDRLTTRNVLQPRRSRIAAATSNDRHHILRPALRTIALQLRAIFGGGRPSSVRGAAGRPSQPAPSPDNADSKPGFPARSFGHPDGVGFIGPGADALLRGVLTEALASKSEVAQVITTRADVGRLFGDAFDESVTDVHASRLRIMDNLEDAIEHLELEAEMNQMISATSTLPIDAPAIVWLATPGPDADVVHETLRHWPDSSLIAFMSGPWPYGATHLIEETGPRPLPSSPISLPSREEAITHLRNRRL